MSSALLTLFAEHRKLVLEHPRHLRRHALLLLHRLFQRPFRTPFQLCHILQHVRERHKVQGVEHVEGVDGRVNGIIYLILEIEEPRPLLAMLNYTYSMVFQRAHLGRYSK